MSTSFNLDMAGAQETLAALRAKQIAARELVERTFERLDKYNPIINAVVWQSRHDAMARAGRADEVLAQGDTLGPLHGLPITIKEAFAYRGSPNSWGLPPLKDVSSPRTAIAVERLEAAGAIVIGKTNTPLMLGDWQSDNPLYGTTNNPWDLSRTAGGSTGGGAAAVATGLGALALGSDLSGSIRIPAHFCGVYGHKPSLALVSLDGFQPGPWDGSPGPPIDVSVAGILARAARDLTVALSVLGGPTAIDAKAWSWRSPASRHTRLKAFRIGYVMDDESAPVSSDVREVYERALAELRRAGAQLSEGWPRGVDPQSAMKTLTYLVMAFVSIGTDAKTLESARERQRKNPQDLAAAAMADPHARWLEASQQRLAYRAAWQRYFDDHDVFLLPTSFTAAFPHDHSDPLENRIVPTPNGPRPYLTIPSWITSASLAGLPATVAPVGRTASDLPVGIQIVGPMWEDQTPIECAALLAEVIGGFDAPPIVQE